MFPASAFPMLGLWAGYHACQVFTWVLGMWTPILIHVYSKQFSYSAISPVPSETLKSSFRHHTPSNNGQLPKTKQFQILPVSQTVFLSFLLQEWRKNWFWFLGLFRVLLPKVHFSGSVVCYSLNPEWSLQAQGLSQSHQQMTPVRGDGVSRTVVWMRMVPVDSCLNAWSPPGSGTLWKD